MTNDLTKVPAPQILPAEWRELRMPSGTPLGLGFLGAAKFGAIRRVLESASRAALAQSGFLDAQAAVAASLVQREIARERLRNLDVIRDEAANQIIDGAYIAGLRRKLETMELEDQIAEREARRARAKGNTSETTVGVARDDFAEFMEGMRRIPHVAQAAAGVKAEIIKSAGGEDKLDDSARQMVEMIDAMVNAFIAKQAEGKMT